MPGLCLTYRTTRLNKDKGGSSRQCVWDFWAHCQMSVVSGLPLSCQQKAELQQKYCVWKPAACKLVALRFSWQSQTKIINYCFFKKKILILSQSHEQQLIGLCAINEQDEDDEEEPLLSGGRWHCCTCADTGERRTDAPQLSQVTQCQRITSSLADAWSAGEQRGAWQTSGNIHRKELPGCLRRSVHTCTHAPLTRSRSPLFLFLFLSPSHTLPHWSVCSAAFHRVLLFLGYMGVICARCNIQRLINWPPPYSCFLGQTFSY